MDRTLALVSVFEKDPRPEASTRSSKTEESLIVLRREKK